MKHYLLIIFLIVVSGCGGDPQNSNLNLDNFIKPEYSTNQTLFNCNLVSGKTLNSVERFIPKFVNIFSRLDEIFEELNNLNFNVFLQDERLSSESAKKIMHEQNIKTGKNKEHIDLIASTIILQSFLDKGDFND